MHRIYKILRPDQNQKPAKKTILDFLKSEPNPSELYQILSLSSKNNLKQKFDQGGLGRQFKKDSRHTLVSKAFKIDDENKTAEIADVDALVKLCLHYRVYTSEEKVVKQDKNKEFTCTVILANQTKNMSVKQEKQNALQNLLKDSHFQKAKKAYDNILSDVQPLNNKITSERNSTDEISFQTNKEKTSKNSSTRISQELLRRDNNSMESPKQTSQPSSPKIEPITQKIEQDKVILEVSENPDQLLKQDELQNQANKENLISENNTHATNELPQPNIEQHSEKRNDDVVNIAAPSNDIVDNPPKDLNKNDIPPVVTRFDVAKEARKINLKEEEDSDTEENLIINIPPAQTKSSPLLQPAPEQPEYTEEQKMLITFYHLMRIRIIEEARDKKYRISLGGIFKSGIETGHPDDDKIAVKYPVGIAHSIQYLKATHQINEAVTNYDECKHHLIHLAKICFSRVIEKNEQKFIKTNRRTREIGAIYDDILKATNATKILSLPLAKDSACVDSLIIDEENITHDLIDKYLHDSNIHDEYMKQLQHTHFGIQIRNAM